MTPSGTKPRKSLRLLGFIGAAIFVPLGFGIVAALFFLDSLALLIAKPLLAPYGIRLLQVEGLQVQLHQVVLEQLSFTLDGAAETSQIEKLDIRFSDKGLLALPIQQLLAERVNIGLADSPTHDSSSAPFTLPDIPRINELLNTLQSIPGNAFRIERLDVAPYIKAGKLTVRRDKRELQVQIAAQDTSADFRVNWHDSDYVSSLFIPDQALDSATPSTEVITGRLLLSALGVEVLSTDFTLSEQDQRLQLEARSLLQLDAFSTFAQQASILVDPLSAVAGQLDVTWRLTEPAREDSTQTIPFFASIAAHSAVTTTLRSELPSGLHSLNWRNAEDLSARGQYALSTQALEFSLSAPVMSVSLGIGQAPLAQLAVSLDELNIDCADSVTCRISQSSTLRLPALTWLDTGVNDLLLISNGTLAFDQGNYTLHFAQGSRLELGSLHLQDLDLSEINALVQQDLDLRIAEDGSVELDSGGVDLYLPNINFDGKTTQFASAITNLNGRLNATETQFEAHVQMRNIGSEWLPFILRKPELEFDFESKSAGISAKGSMRVADREITQFDGQMDIDAFTGKVNFETPVLNFENGDQSLAQWFFQAPFEADIISGSLQSSAQLQFERNENGTWRVDGPLQLDINKISGFYQETAIIGMNTTLRGTLQDSVGFVSDGLSTFSLASIDLGLPVENISLQYGVDTSQTQVSIQDIEAGLFGGRVHSAGLIYDWSAASNSVTIDVERIDISRMLDLAAYDSIKATGFVSGTIPITLTGTKPSVGAGRLQVEAPGGAIHYSPEGGMKTGNASLDLVNQALSNYQYSLMETEVEYLPSGELELGVKLQGRNPDLNDGQRINLNLNISDNIPMLLRSLQSGRSIAEAVERELRAR